MPHTKKIFLFIPKFKSYFVQGRNMCSENIKKYDVAVVGGGIVGVASAREMINRDPHMKMALVEKEDRLAFHQTGHNSGVIHAGIYYKPGTLKAKLCVEGNHMIYKYCEEKNIPFKKCGKLIVATNPKEVEHLNDLYKRGLENEVQDLKVLCEHEIKEYEPHCDGLGAISSPNTGIIDYAVVTRYLAKDFCRSGGDIYLNFEADQFTESSDPEYPILVTAADGQRLLAKHVLTCGGLQSDRLAVKTGCSSEPKIIPVRGEYLILHKDKRYLVKGNIYPVPDPSLPFLGVHCTPRIDGNIWLGPNAVFALKREGYKWSDINLWDFSEVIFHRGFQKLAFRHMMFGIKEMVRSAIVPLQVSQLNRYLPDLTDADVERGPAGVRAQAMDEDGNLVDDFVFDKGTEGFNSRILHCRNAPSPGATSSMAIAKMVADKMKEQFKEIDVQTC